MPSTGLLLLLFLLPALLQSVVAVTDGIVVQNMSQFPNLARLLGPPSPSSFNFACTASIVSPRHVISAAHCFRGGGGGSNRRAFNAAVKPGVFIKLTDISPGLYATVNVNATFTSSREVISVNVSRLAVSPQFTFPNGYPNTLFPGQAFVNNNPLDWERDIVLLELAEPLNLTENVQPIKLLSEKGYRKISPDVKDQAIMAGWQGSADNPLKYGYWKMSDNEVCSFGAVYYYYFWQNYRNFSGSPMSVDTLGQVQQNMSLALDEGLVCGTPNPSNMDGGNSGGPSMVRSEKGQLYQIGIISNNYALTADGLHSNRGLAFIFTRVSANCDWINQLTKGQVECNDYK